MRLACIAALAIIGLAGCTNAPYSVMDLDGQTLLATCYADMRAGFCRVVSPPGTSVVPEGSMVSAAAGIATTGAMMAGMGAASAYMAHHR